MLISFWISGIKCSKFKCIVMRSRVDRLRYYYVNHTNNRLVTFSRPEILFHFEKPFKFETYFQFLDGCVWRWIVFEETNTTNWWSRFIVGSVGFGINSQIRDGVLLMVIDVQRLVLASLNTESYLESLVLGLDDWVWSIDFNLNTVPAYDC